VEGELEKHREQNVKVEDVAQWPLFRQLLHRL
jgi:hypothetical protein